MRALLILPLLAFALLAGCTGEAPEPTALPPSPECTHLYWLDGTSAACGYREFCGAYAYHGLQTFETLAECEAALSPAPQEEAPQPNPNRMTYIYLRRVFCNINNFQITLENTGPFDSGRPLVRVHELSGGEPQKLCMELTLPSEIYRSSTKELVFSNALHAVEKCEFTEGSFRISMAEEPNTGMAVFRPIDFSC